MTMWKKGVKKKECATLIDSFILIVSYWFLFFFGGGGGKCKCLLLHIAGNEVRVHRKKKKRYT